MSLIDTILGRRLASSEAGQQRIGTAAGVPTFGLDALSSAAYGPEAALTVLLPLGAAGLTFILPITVAIAILLGIIYISYRQTIAAYPNGTQIGLGNALITLAHYESDARSYDEAAAALLAALGKLSPDTQPEAWATAQEALGNTLKGLGDRKSNIDDLKQAVDTF